MYRQRIYPPRAVHLRLHSHNRVVCKHTRQPSPDQQVAAKRPVGDSAVDHDDRNVTVAAHAQKIRPDFRFSNDHRLRIDSRQYAGHGERQIDWKIERVIDNVGPHPGKFLTRGC